MELTVKKLHAAEMTDAEFLRYAEIERAGRYHFTDYRILLQDLERYETYACYDGTRMAAFLMLDPYCRYFGRSIYIVKARLAWDYNRDEVLVSLIRSSLRLREGTAGRMITLDSDKRYDPYRKIYYEMGFKDSLMNSSYGFSHTVMIAFADELMK